MDDHATQNTQPSSAPLENLPPVTEGPRPWATLVSINELYPSVKLFENEYVMGRGRSCSESLRYDDMRVSGKHAKITREKTDGDKNDYLIFATDMSSNGTFVNGKKIGKNKKCLLRNNDELALVIIKKGAEALGKNACVAYVVKLDQCNEPTTGDPEETETIGAVYAIQHTLGTGNFAVVKVGAHMETGKKVAVKIIDKKKFRMNASLREDSLKDEVNVLKQISHPNIISILETFETERFLYLVLELVTGGELFDRILEKKRFDEPLARRTFLQIADAVRYLHSKGIAHRDLKPENILLSTDTDDAVVKLTDFGLARIIGDVDVMTTLCGTPQYLAPEVITSQNTAGGGYDLAVDLWSMGVILYILLCGYPPFYEERGIPVYEQITKGMVNYDGPVWNTLSPEAVSLVKGLLTVPVPERLTIEDIYGHPWIAGAAPAAVAAVAVPRSPPRERQTRPRSDSDTESPPAKRTRR